MYESSHEALHALSRKKKIVPIQSSNTAFYSLHFHFRHARLLLGGLPEEPVRHGLLLELQRLQCHLGQVRVASQPDRLGTLQGQLEQRGLALRLLQAMLPEGLDQPPILIILLIDCNKSTKNSFKN
jgi:hypothetical protein